MTIAERCSHAILATREYADGYPETEYIAKGSLEDCEDHLEIVNQNLHEPKPREIAISYRIVPIASLGPRGRVLAGRSRVAHALLMAIADC